jgi:hypothetical protein
LDELRALVRAQADEARAEPIARLARIGLKAGMAQGDGPAEKAAAAINRELVALDDALWGHGLIRVLRDEKLAPAPQDYSPYVRAETSFYQEYDRARVDALLAFLRDLEKKGYAWDHGGSRMLMGSDRARRLREAIALVEGLRKDLPER